MRQLVAVGVAAISLAWSQAAPPAGCTTCGPKPSRRRHSASSQASSGGAFVTGWSLTRAVKQ